MFANLTGWHALIILAIVLLLFGAPKLPALARSLGQSMKILKSETRSAHAETDTDRDAPAESHLVDGVASAAPTSAERDRVQASPKAG